MIEYIDNYEILKSFPIAGNETSISKTNNTLNYVVTLAGGIFLGCVIYHLVNEYKMNYKMKNKIRKLDSMDNAEAIEPPYPVI